MRAAPAPSPENENQPRAFLATDTPDKHFLTNAAEVFFKSRSGEAG